MIVTTYPMSIIRVDVSICVKVKVNSFAD